MPSSYQNGIRGHRQWHNQAPDSVRAHKHAKLFFVHKMWQDILHAVVPDRQPGQRYTDAQYAEAERIQLEVMDAAMDLKAAAALVEKYGLHR